MRHLVIFMWSVEYFFTLYCNLNNIKFQIMAMRQKSIAKVLFTLRVKVVSSYKLLPFINVMVNWNINTFKKVVSLNFYT